MVKKNSDLWSLKHKMENFRLFGNQLSFPKIMSTVEHVLEKRVMCFVLAENTFRFLQPLDNVIFACKKHVF